MTVPGRTDTWRKSSRSTQTDNCVEVSLSRSARVRDTKDRDGGTVQVPFTAWRAFTASLSEL
ncbi:DUF397 domain-containing protein [Haloechinothrix sp. YIM 98757]|uniref:DUF397 domain-containing protein n=1 Tax=Haloechinothrix aidingensis TaxID=2752311 RepID=A0A838ACB8_9PSEU|nr:DUF397 domain-containing protein [Haloechinothrix aidingensis]MBA0126904.1 DUF397 domain-containing protein [Haloechinothrix aidingensis]